MQNAGGCAEPPGSATAAVEYRRRRGHSTRLTRGVAAIPAPYHSRTTPRRALPRRFHLEACSLSLLYGWRLRSARRSPLPGSTRPGPSGLAFTTPNASRAWEWLRPERWNVRTTLAVSRYPVPAGVNGDSRPKRELSCWRIGGRGVVSWIFHRYGEPPQPIHPPRQQQRGKSAQDALRERQSAETEDDLPGVPLPNREVAREAAAKPKSGHIRRWLKITRR